MQDLSENELQIVLDSITKQQESTITFLKWMLIGVGTAAGAGYVALWAMIRRLIKQIGGRRGQE